MNEILDGMKGWNTEGPAIEKLSLVARAEPIALFTSYRCSSNPDSDQMRKYTRLVLALVITLSASLVTQSFTQSLLPKVPEAHATNMTISLVGNFNGWNFSLPSGSNPTITVNQGDVITISLTSVDATHQFALDVDKDGPKFTGTCTAGDTCSGTFSPSSPASVMINTAGLSGTFTYFCTFHSAMVGSFVVVGSVGGNIVPTNSLGVIAPYLTLAGLGVTLIGGAIVLRSKRHKNTSMTH